MVGRRTLRVRLAAAAARTGWPPCLALCLLLWAPLPAAAQTAEPAGPVVSAAGEVYVGSGPAARRAAAARAALRSALEPTVVVELPPVGEGEGQRTARTDVGDRPEPEPERIGFGRDVPAHLAANESRLVWVSLPDGGRAATLAVRSPGAAALRVRLDFAEAPADLELRFYNPLDRDGAVGPVGAAELLADRPEGDTHGLYWSPTVDGDTLAVEFHMAGSGKLSFSMVVVSHLEVSPLDVADLGDASSCTIDLACRPDAISGIAARSVAKYILTRSSGRSSGCTAQLISDLHPESQTPYLLTARHCVGTQGEASSMEFYWRFEFAGCGEEGLHADYGRTPGGAFLLGSETHRGGTDYALLRMKQAPPTHVGMAGWTTATVAPGTPVVGVSHPRLDVKKISLGHVTRHESWIDDPHATHIVLRLSEGAVQGGSSGSGLWTRTTGGDYLVGVLTGGTGGCTQQRLYYGRMDEFYPKVRPWLGSVAPIRFALLDAASGAELLELVPDASFDLSSADADSFNILAQRIGGDPVGGMELTLAGPQPASRTSVVPPYTLYGEGGGGGLPPGDYTVTARTAPGGTAGANERSVAFTVTGDAEDDDFRLTGLTLTTTGGSRVASLTADAVVDLARRAEDAQYDIRADSAGTAPIGSVAFELSGAGEASATDSTAPFALRGPLPPGSYRITATPYPDAAGGGTAGTALAVDFTVTRASPITGFTLVDARGDAPDEDLTAIADGATLDLSALGNNLGNHWLTIRADVADGARVGSVAFTLTGPASVAMTDTDPPFAMRGDDNNGDYYGMRLPDGDYRITAVPYTGREESGDARPTAAVDFTVTGSYDPDVSPVTGFTLVDATGDPPDPDLTAIADGATLDLSSYATTWFNIRADVAGGPLGSVRLELAGPVSVGRTENAPAPYTVKGENGDDYWSMQLPNGDYTITATAYTGRNLSRDARPPVAVDFTVTGSYDADASPVTGFTLVDSSGDPPDPDLTAIAAGATLDLSSYATTAFNIRADVAAAPAIGSVRLELAGPVSVGRTENAPAPYTVRGDNGDDYWSMALPNGDYTITATPYTGRNRSGDALPAAAVDFTVTGSVDADASPVTGFTLVDARGDAPDEDVMAIAAGATLDLSALGSHWLTIRADVAAGAGVRSVAFTLAGPASVIRTDSDPPFAMRRDDKNGDYYGMKLPNGDYRITATPYTRREESGDALPAAAVDFTVIGSHDAGASPVTGFTLVDATGDAPDDDVTAIADGATLDLSPYLLSRFNIRADVAAGADVHSVRLELAGPVSTGRTENAPAPYTLRGDDGDDYGSMELPNGDYTITATAYPGRNLSGDALPSAAVAFTVTGSYDAEASPVTGFTLVDATGDPPDPDLTAIAPGATLDLSSYATTQFSIRADVAGAPAIGSVRLELAGPVSESRTENAPAPYAVRGDDGDGDYWSMLLPNGDYTITATPYPGRNLSGDGLPAATVDFTVTGSYDSGASPVAGFTLVNATGDAPDEDVTAIADGATLDLAEVDGHWFSIRADVETGRGVRSMWMYLTGPVSRTRLENSPPPYAIRGDDHEGDYYGMGLPNGDYRIRAVPYGMYDGVAGQMPELAVGFTVTGSYEHDANPLTGFTLVDARGDAPDEDVMAIADDATLDVSALGNHWLTIRADIVEAALPGVGSVWLELEGPVSRALRENAPPFALNGDDGDGDYYGVRLANGDYRVMATAYARDDLLGGTLGSATVAFTVDGGVDASDVPLTGFTLIDADTDQDAAAVADGATLDVAELGGATTKFTFRADAAEDAVVGSVLLELTGPVRRAVQRDAAPFSLHPASDGDYGGTHLGNGDYRLTATPYTGQNLSGDPLPVLEAGFTVTGSYDPDASPVTGFTLVDAHDDPPDPDLTAVADGATLDISSYATHWFNIRADVAAVPPIGSMRLELDGPVSASRRENAPAPYTVKGENGDDYYGTTLPNGDYTVTATPYPGRDLSGDALPVLEAGFTVTGSYDPDASPVTGFTLVDAHGDPPDPDLTAVADGATLDISSYATHWFNIRADVAAVPPIGSMRLELDGPVSASRRENAPAPYTVKGENGDDYYGTSLPNGDYTVTATPYPGRDLSGNALPPATVDFTVTGGVDPDASPVTGFTLVDARGGAPDEDVTAIADGATLDVSALGNHWLTIRADVADGARVGSVAFTLTGPASVARTDTDPPFAMRRDDKNGDYYGMKLPDGDYRITAVPYTGRDATGSSLAAATVDFTVTGGVDPDASPVTGFTLVDARGGAPDEDVTAIADGATLDVSALGNHWLTIRADVAAGAGVRSVAFTLTGPASVARTDSDPPFAMRRDDKNGDYYGMKLPDGDYRITAVPYTGREESGDALPSATRAFTVTRAGDDEPALTARFEDMPAAHDGAGAFRFRVAFSEDIGISFRALREDAFAVTGGGVTGGARVDGRRDLFEMTVEPDGAGDVTIELPAGRDCAVSGAICTKGEPRRRLTNTPSATVAGPGAAPENTPATGAPTIAGTARVGETLTASTSGIADADGLDNATFAYRWIRGDADISGARGRNYTAVDADEGERLKVRVQFTDDADNAERLTSAATDPVSARPNTPATGAPTIAGTARVGETLTASTSGIADADGLDNATFAYRWIRGDADISGARGRNYTAVDADEGERLKVRVQFTDDADNAERLTSTATDPVSARPNTPATGAPTIAGTARVGETLTASTSGIADADGLDNATFAYRWIRGDADISGARGRNYTAVDADEGERLKVRVQFTDDAGNAERLTSAATGPVAARPNTPATGAPTIAGTARVGETLTASTSGIADADGLANAAFAYRWVRGDADISGARGRNYTAVDADEGERLKVRVQFTDDTGNAERLTSAATGPVAAARPKLKVSVADARVREAAGATLDFAVTLSGPATGPVTVDYRTLDASAKAGEDYEAREGTLTFGAGETDKTLRVTVLDDAVDEGDEKMVVVLQRADGAVRDDYLAVGTIEDSDD